MGQGTQSEDNKEHNASEMERFFTYQEIWYSQYVRPAIKEDVKDQFEKCSVPIIRKINDINTRLLLKSIALFMIVLILLLFKIS